MIFPKRQGAQYMITSVLTIICVLLTFGATTIDYHHDEDGCSHETCSLCFLLNLFSGIHISEVPSVLCSVEIYVLVVSYSIIYFNNINSFYHPRSPPLFTICSNKFTSMI